MNEFDYNKPRNGGYPHINNSSPSRPSGGTVIDPTGTFTKAYLNCDATAADLEEAFGSIPENQWVTGSEWGIFENGYAAFCGEIRGGQPDNAIIVLKNPLPSGKYGYLFMLAGYPKFERYLYSPEPAQDGSVQIAAGWHKLVVEDDTFIPVFSPVSGIQEFDSDESAVGRSYIESPRGTRYDVGLSNSKLTKILSFNEPFSSAAEDHELSYTNRDGIVDKDFRYDRPKTGGYPFTNVDGPTPADSTKFLNWTKRDDNVPSGPGATINPTEVLSKLYINCDSTAEEVEEAFGNLPYTTVDETLRYYAYAYQGNDGDGYHFGFNIAQENNVYQITILCESAADDELTAMEFFRYDRINKVWERGSVGATRIDYSETSGIHEIDSGTSDIGVAQLIDGTPVGSANDKLTKIFSFNEPFNN